MPVNHWYFLILWDKKMPRFGLKYFLGSFLLSLVAVFAATKAYIIVSSDQKKESTSLPVNFSDTRNIELTAVNEENDPLYEKFNKLDQLRKDTMQGLSTDKAALSVASVVNAAQKVYEKAASEEEKDSIIIADEKLDASTFAEDISYTDEFEQEDKEELVIADASEAPRFSIPLLHHFMTENGKVTVSDRADESQVALASPDVRLDNLGAADKAAVTEEMISGIADTTANIQSSEDDPWEVAETANTHASKNTLHSSKVEQASSVSAMDKSNTNVADNTEVPYKMQKNLLVPIPEDIMNETDMTPQLSTSEENKRIEEQLRANKELPHKNPAIKDSLSQQPESVSLQSSESFASTKSVDEDETSKSLTDSIAAWFSNSQKKETKENSKKLDSQSNRDQSNSIFQKLLGIGSENVTPTELKLSFQPNRAEISGQTLEWLHAFSDNAVKYDNVLVEIRLSKTAPYELQQKRLKLLYRILANNGVEYNKVNIIFTDREPNSFIIRNVRYATEEEQQKALAAKTYSPWY